MTLEKKKEKESEEPPKKLRGISNAQLRLARSNMGKPISILLVQALKVL
jgi:hypothetical protein